MSNDVFSKDEKYIILNFTKLEPIAVVGGKGTTLRDMEGKEYLNCYASILVVDVACTQLNKAITVMSEGLSEIEKGGL